MYPTISRVPTPSSTKKLTGAKNFLLIRSTLTLSVHQLEAFATAPSVTFLLTGVISTFQLFTASSSAALFPSSYAFGSGTFYSFIATWAALLTDSTTTWVTWFAAFVNSTI